STGPLIVSVPRGCVDPWWLWRARPIACRNRNLWRRFLFGRTTHAGNRRAHGVGREAERCTATRTRPGTVCYCFWARGGLVARVCLNAFDIRVSLRSRSNRSVDVLRSAAAAGHGGAGGFLHTGVAGD